MLKNVLFCIFLLCVGYSGGKFHQILIDNEKLKDTYDTFLKVSESNAHTVCFWTSQIIFFKMQAYGQDPTKIDKQQDKTCKMLVEFANENTVKSLNLLDH